MQINELGRVIRCGAPVSYGNMLSGNVSLPGDIHRCKNSYCTYFCEKYSVPLSEPNQMVQARQILNQRQAENRLPGAAP